MEKLIINEYDPTIEDERCLSYDLEEVLNIVTRDGFTILNLKDGTNVQFEPNSIEIYFR